MMGSAEALPEAPVKQTMFMEDMTEEQLASAVSIIGCVHKVKLKLSSRLPGVVPVSISVRHPTDIQWRMEIPEPGPFLSQHGA